MSENTQSNNSQKTNSGAKRWLSQLYRTRVKVQKDNVPVMNVSAGFTALGVLCAPWLAAGGAAIALAMGYQFSVERNAQGFSRDFEDVVQEAASNVRNAVDGLTRNAARPSGDMQEGQPSAAGGEAQDAPTAVSHDAQEAENPFASFSAQAPRHPFATHMAQEEQPAACDEASNTPAPNATPYPD